MEIKIYFLNINGIDYKEDLMNIREATEACEREIAYGNVCYIRKKNK